ncbi:hypothetical protein ACHHV8_29550 [Paenibacillus sp. TAB 01]
MAFHIILLVTIAARPEQGLQGQYSLWNCLYILRRTNLVRAA